MSSNRVLRDLIFTKHDSDSDFCADFEAFEYKWRVVLFDSRPGCPRMGMSVRVAAARTDCYDELLEKLKTDMFTVKVTVLDTDGNLRLQFPCRFKGLEGFCEPCCAPLDYRDVGPVELVSVLGMRAIVEMEKNSPADAGPSGIMLVSPSHDSLPTSRNDSRNCSAPDGPTAGNQPMPKMVPTSDSRDIVLKVGRKEFIVHGNLLREQSETWAALVRYARSRGTSEIVLDGVSVCTMEAVIQFLYEHTMDHVGENFEMLLELLKFAGKYKMKSLIAGCEDYLIQIGDIVVDNVSAKRLLFAFVTGSRLGLSKWEDHVIDLLKKKKEKNTFSSWDLLEFVKQFPEAASRMLYSTLNPRT